MKVAPLSNGFALTAILGFLISAVYVLPKTETWGFTFLVFFAVMFVSSMISMTKAPIDDVHIKELSMHNKKRRAKK